MVLIKQVIEAIEQVAPLTLQEPWDNSGLQVGDVMQPCTGALLAVEATEATVAEAADKGYNLLITHHPILFNPLKHITPYTYVERTIALALAKGVAIYASHTASDNTLHAINGALAKRLLLKQCAPLVPQKGQLVKLEVTVPQANAEELKNALFVMGAGKQGNYAGCCFSLLGEGEFLPQPGANPTLGKIGNKCYTPEVKLSLLVNYEHLPTVLNTLKAVHPYEELAYDLIPLSNTRSDSGSGLVGMLPTGCSENELLEKLAKWPYVERIAHSNLTGKTIHKIAICSGAGGSFLPQAVKAGCQVLITGEAKYNHYLDAAGYANGGILLITLGHFESETIARDHFLTTISARIPNFVLEVATNDANPVHYFH